jgi:TonB-linked SusC/RagA family outer membrane protein
MHKTKTSKLMRAKNYLLLLAMLLVSSITWAQNRTITGKVTDENGKAVENASITIKGTQNGVSADANGNFKITAKTGDVLVISSVNFASREVRVGEGNAVSATLTHSESSIEDVVVTAQGIRKKAKEIGYAYAKVSGDEITVGRSPQLAQALSGKVSGLAIYNVNNSVDPTVKVVLRGYRSLTGNNEALVVVDGMQTTQTVLALINPNDIESVSILKGGQAATLYGSAGINGAIVITTKKGTAGKLKVALSHTTNVEQISFLPEFQDKYGSGSHYALSFGQAGYQTDYLQRMKDNWRPFENQQFGDPYDGQPRITGRVAEDGSKFIIPYAAVKNGRYKTFDVGMSMNNQINFSGGEKGSTYYMSVENNKIKGIVPHDESGRTSVRIAASKEADKLSVDFTASYVQANYKRTSADFYFDIMNTAAHIPTTELRDWQTDKFANPNGYYNDYYNNPYFNADNNRNNYTDANIQGNFGIAYKAFPWMNITNRLGVMNNTRFSKAYTGKFLYTDWAKHSAYVPAPWDYANDYDGIDRAGTDILGAVGDGVGTENVINNEFQLQFSKDLGRFSNKLIVGQSIYQRKTKGVSVNSTSVVVPEVYNVSNRQGELQGGEANTTERKYGYYADITSTFNEYLSINGTFRYDATSKFFKPYRSTNQYAYPYYGAALSFVATDAFPGIKSKMLNYAKLRLSVNKNGNDNLGLNVVYGLDLAYPNGLGFPYGNTVGLTVGNILPDANLKPEFVTSYEVGGELQLFNNRVNLDVTAYQQISKGQVITVKVPNTTGFPNLLINVGESHNWGYEADLKVQILRGRNVKWDVGARYSFNANKVIDLYPGVDNFLLSGYAYASTYVIKGQGFPFLKATDYVRDPATNRVIVDKTSGYPVLNSALQNFGNTLPKHIAGLSSRLSYKDFGLNFNFEYRGGNKIFSQIGRDLTFTGAGKWTEERTPHIFPNSAYDDGTGKIIPNTSVQVRESEYSLWVDYYRQIASNFVTPGWFIKLRDVNLSYSIPSSVIKKTKIFSAANIALYGRNLFTLIDKSNYYTDPEFSFTANNGIGINNSLQTPPVRQFGVNVNFTF